MSQRVAYSAVFTDDNGENERVVFFIESDLNGLTPEQYANDIIRNRDEVLDEIFEEPVTFEDIRKGLDGALELVCTSHPNDVPEGLQQDIERALAMLADMEERA